jgi:tripartite-type tricarboxylate transporter receptor subunit TctC
LRSFWLRGHVTHTQGTSPIDRNNLPVPLGSHRKQVRKVGDTAAVSGVEDGDASPHAACENACIRHNNGLPIQQPGSRVATMGFRTVDMKANLRARWTAAVLTALLLPSIEARADTVSDFYKGKQINLIVGTPAGGGYDVYGRVLGHHIGKYIPGTPNVVVQNMPGAAGLRAANYLYNVAPKDGTTFGIFAHDLVLIGALGANPNVQFDVGRFVWLGSSSSFVDDAYLLIARADAAVKSADDARRPGGPPLLMGVSAEGGGTNTVTNIIRDVLGFNLKSVTGYPGSNEMNLAIDRGEVEGRLTAISALHSTKPKWLSPDSGMRVLLQFARSTRHHEFPDAPTARELARDDFARGLIELAELPYFIDRPFAAPPEVPADRAKALQDAFVAAHADPQYLEEAKKLKIEVSPIGADGVQRVLARIAAASPEARDYMKKLLGGKGE